MRRQGLLSASGILLLGLIVLMTLHEWDNPLEDDREAFLSAPLIIADTITAKAYDRKPAKSATSSRPTIWSSFSARP